MNVNQRVDKDGVLNFIQKLEYNNAKRSFKVTYFTGWQRVFPASRFCDGSLLEGNPSLVQWLEAYRNIEQHSLDQWAAWYVDRFNMRWMYEKDVDKDSMLLHNARLHLCGKRGNQTK